MQIGRNEKKNITFLFFGRQAFKQTSDELTRNGDKLISGGEKTCKRQGEIRLTVCYLTVCLLKKQNMG